MPQRTSPIISRLLLFSLCAVGSLSTGCGSIFILPAQAQVPPVAPEPGDEDAQKDTRVFVRLRKRLAPIEQSNPRSALTQYQQFLAARPTIEPEAGVLVSHSIAQVLFRGMEDIAKADETYDRAIKQYQGERSVAGLLTEKAKLMLAQDKNSEAEAFLLKAWPGIAESESQKADPVYAGPMLYQLCVALTRQGRKEQAVALLHNAFMTVPVLLDDGQQGSVNSRLPGQSVPRAGWMYGLLTDLLQEQGHKDQALGWAKLRWMTCNFEDAEIGRASRMLAKTWKSAEPSGASLLTFVAHQKGKPIPPVKGQTKSYEQIALPTFNAQTLQERITTLQDNKGKTFAGQSTQKINIHILLGQWHEAMAEACSYLLVRPSAKARVQGVARVLKAADGNMERANAFTAFFLTGTGDNPLPAFFKDYPRPATASKPLLVPAVDLVENVTARAGQRKPGSPFAAPVPVAALTSPLVALQIAQPAANAPMTSEQMWKGGLLSAEDALYALAHGGVDGELLSENHDIKAELAGVVVRHGEEIGDAPGLRDPRVRLSIGDYYRGQKDVPRAIEVYRSLVAQGRLRGTAPGEGGAPSRRAWFYMVSVERLGAIYRDQKDNVQFEELWTNERREAGEGSEMFNTATLILARHYAATGQADKSKATYAQAAAGSGWIAMMAVWDQANALVDKQQYVAALQMLEPALEATKTQGEEAAKDDAGRNPNLARMGLLVLTGFCHYKVGNRDAAERLSREALALYEISDVTANLGIDTQADKARATLEWVGKWKKAVLESNPAALRLKATPVQTRVKNPVPLSAWMTVHSPQAVELRATCENSQITLLVADKAQEEEFFWGRNIEVRIAPQAFARGLQTSILISAQTKNGLQELRVPVTVAATSVLHPPAQ